MKMMINPLAPWYSVKSSLLSRRHWHLLVTGPQAHPDPLNQNLYAHSTQRFGERVLSGGSPGEPRAAGLGDHDVGDIVTKGEGGQNGMYRGNEKELTVRDAVEEGPFRGPCF